MGNQRPRARFAQGFGGQDEVVDRHHATPHAGVQRIQIAVAGKHDRIRRDRVRAGLDRAGHAGCKAGDRRPFADIDACLYRRLGEAARVVERMKVARALIEKAAVKPLRRHLRAESRAIEHVNLIVAVAGAEMLGLPRQRARVARAVRSDGNTGLQVALNPVPGDAGAHQRLRLLGKRPEEPRPVLAELPLQGGLIAPMPAAELPAVAAGGAVADAPSLQQEGAEASFGEMERTREPGVAAADDADIRALIAVEGGPGRVRPRTRLVPGGRRAVVLRVAAGSAHHTARRRNLRSHELTTRR